MRTRWAALILLIAICAVIMVALADRVSAVNNYPFGCCLVPQSDCRPSLPFVDAQAFKDSCDSAGGEIKQGAICETSCKIGCCCAGPSVPGSAEINKTEDRLRMSQWACVQKSTASLPYTFKDQVSGKTCVQVCGGIAPAGGGATSYTLSGKVRKAGLPAAATVTMYTSGVDKTVSTDAGGLYREVLPANKQYSVTVEPADAGCRPQTVTVLMNRDMTKDFVLDCTERPGCKNPVPVITNVTITKGTDGATFDITYNSECGQFDSFVPYVCEGGKDAQCQPLDSTTSTKVSVTGLKPETQYCFWVRAYQKPTGVAESVKVCTLKTGDAECMEDRPASWCSTTAAGSAILSCDEKNELLESACADGQVCSQTTQGPKCVPKISCAKCNGLLGLYASENIAVPSGFGNYAPTCDTQTQCYLERTFVPSYQECVGVTSCADYKSKESCAARRCDIKSCEWREGNKELGTGICTTTDPAEVSSCRQCSAAFGYCNATLCTGISASCYYDAVENNFFRDGRAQCLPKQDMACRFYDTAADCGNAKVDINYDGIRRISGTNAVTKSNDKFGFGVCQWIAEMGRCVKNADNYIDPANPEDDCLQAGLSGEDLLRCLGDNTPPTTEFILKNPAIYGSSEINTLPFRVTDDITPAAGIRTFFCMNTSAAQCYPNSTLARLEIPDVDADYRISYYSMDANFNSEPVKSITVMARKDGVVRLQKITITEDGG